MTLIEIGEQAKQEIDEALVEKPLEGAALVIHSGDPEVCCTVGFEVVLVEKRDVPSKSITRKNMKRVRNRKF